MNGISWIRKKKTFIRKYNQLKYFNGFDTLLTFVLISLLSACSRYQTVCSHYDRTAQNLAKYIHISAIWAKVSSSFSPLEYSRGHFLSWLTHSLCEIHFQIFVTLSCSRVTTSPKYLFCQAPILVKSGNIFRSVSKSNLAQKRQCTLNFE